VYKNNILAIFLIIMMLGLASCGDKQEQTIDDSNASQTTEEQIKELSDLEGLKDITESMIKSGSIGNEFEDIIVRPAPHNYPDFKRGFSEYLDSFTGVQCPLIIDAKEECAFTFEFEMHFTENEEHFRVYMLVADGTLRRMLDYPHGETGFTLKKGKNKLLFVGYKASGSILITFKPSDKYEVIPQLLSYYLNY